MNKRRVVRLFIFSPIILGGLLSPIEVRANQINGSGNIAFEGNTDPNPGVVDPETQEPANPGETAKTEGPLRIDFAPNLTFATTEITSNDLVSQAYGQMFHNGESRGNFIQVSDYRGSSTGWTLQVRQEHQFKIDAANGAQLKGAYISLDKAWTNSTSDATKSPKVSKDVINMNNIGETYPLAEASFGNGGGTWSIIFGASDENQSNQANTLVPLVDEKGKAVTNPDFENQPIFTNQAVTLTIPKTNQLVPGNYTTVLTWIISELP